jgi:hypothetical protein
MPRRSQRLSNCTEYLRYRGPHYPTQTAPIVPERRQKSLHWQSSGSRTQGARAQLPNMASTCDQMAYLKEGRETAMSAVMHVHTVHTCSAGRRRRIRRLYHAAIMVSFKTRYHLRGADDLLIIGSYPVVSDSLPNLRSSSVLSSLLCPFPSPSQSSTTWPVSLSHQGITHSTSGSDKTLVKQTMNSLLVSLFTEVKRTVPVCLPVPPLPGCAVTRDVR